jgi:hypothetical protein
MIRTHYRGTMNARILGHLPAVYASTTIMVLSASDLDNLEKLKAALVGEPHATKLEHLAAALLGRMVGVTIAVAKSGFQHVSTPN